MCEMISGSVETMTGRTAASGLAVAGTREVGGCGAGLCVVDDGNSVGGFEREREILF